MEEWVDYFCGDKPPEGPVIRRLRNGMKVMDIENEGRWEIFNTTSDTIQYCKYDPNFEIQNWIKWLGGIIPVGNVIVKRRNGRTFTGDARTFNWELKDSSYDISEYATI